MLLCIFISIALFIIGTLGVFLTKHNIILSVMSLELMLLAINYNFIFFSLYTDTLIGQIITFFILIVAAAESVIGLLFVIIYYKGYNFYV